VNTPILSASSSSLQGPTTRPFRRRDPEWKLGTKFEKWRFWVPYGCWRTADGREVLFNRSRTPLWERGPRFHVREADHDEWVAEIVACRYYFNDATSPVSFYRTPASVWRPTLERINNILVRWRLQPLPPRPTPRASAPSRLRRREQAARLAAIEATMPPEFIMASAADWREIEERKVSSSLSPRAIINKHKIEPTKATRYLLDHEMKPWNRPVYDRSETLFWLARSLLERGVPPSEAYPLLRHTGWNKHRHENEYRLVNMTWVVIEKAWSKPFIPWAEQQRWRKLNERRGR
jgi:hypothetical protein